LGTKFEARKGWKEFERKKERKKDLVVDLKEKKWKKETTKEKGLRIKLTIAQ
jgi:hypothetical protein